jgi:hypothetical protein
MLSYNLGVSIVNLCGISSNCLFSALLKTRGQRRWQAAGGG